MAYRKALPLRQRLPDEDRPDLQSSPIFTNPPKTAILYIVVSKRGGGTMEQELERLEGTVEDIIYLNEDNGYTVF